MRFKNLFKSPNWTKEKDESFSMFVLCVVGCTLMGSNIFLLVRML